MNDNDKQYKTTDMALATTLAVLGTYIQGVDRSDPRKIEFIFTNSEDLQKAVKAYWAKELLVEPLQFFNEMRTIKSRIYDN